MTIATFSDSVSSLSFTSLDNSDDFSTRSAMCGPAIINPQERVTPTTEPSVQDHGVCQ